MKITEQHFSDTYKKINNISKKDFANWLLNNGYYPETYVFPPNFRVSNFILSKPIFKVKNGKLVCEPKELSRLSYPKNDLTDITFSVLDPKIYHDLVYYMYDSWSKILKHLFEGSRSIYSYSFPIPFDWMSGELLTKRSERMIYQYIEGAERDLVIDAVNYKYVIHIDIKNFYPSIYTHSFPWALSRDRRKTAQTKIGGFTKNHPGNKFDILFQRANDSRTNGIAIGPVVSDLMAEIVLSAIDQNIKLPKNCFGIRFKDDYRIVCNSKSEAQDIIKEFKCKLDDYNLVLSDNKTKILEYPDGLYREWIIRYEKVSNSLKNNDRFTFKAFKVLYDSTIKIHKRFSVQGTIEKMLGEIVEVGEIVDIKIDFYDDYRGVKQKKLFITYLWKLVSLREKSIGMILGIIEYYYDNELQTQEYIEKLIINEYTQLSADIQTATNSSFKYLWIYYFVMTNNIKIPNGIDKSNEVLNKVFRVNTKWKDFFSINNTNTKTIFFTWKPGPVYKKEHGNILVNVALFQNS